MNTLSVQPVLLGVNIDHVATLRQARGTRYPDPVHAAFEAEAAGADAITIHLREDRRHIQDRDVQLLHKTLQTRMNFEIAATDAMIEFASSIRPSDCCLVPERREELTTEGGLEVAGDMDRISRACGALADCGIRVSLFIDPEFHQLEASVSAGAPVVELHTGGFADADSSKKAGKELERITEAVKYGSKLGLHINAGHGLHYHNVAAIARIPQIRELNIGHAIVARSIFVGMGNAVREMKTSIERARRVGDAFD